MIFVFFWIGFAIIVGVAANNRGRSGIGWAFLAILISPILAGLLLLALSRRDLLTDIATIAAIEATPEGSQSRQLLAAYQITQTKQTAKTATMKAAIKKELLGHADCRPWS
jgi:hypothetical protein